MFTGKQTANRQTIQQESIEIHNQDIGYKCVVKRTARKTVAVSVHHDGSVIVYSPKHIPQDTIKKIAEKNILWIHNNVLRAIKKRDLTEHFYTKCSSKEILFLGKKLFVKTGVQQTEDFIQKNDTLQIKTADVTGIRLSVKAFYRRMAKKIFYARTAYWIGEIPFSRKDTKITIKTMKTRWGSMSSAGHMSLNLSLIQTPMECIDYVIVHELCHQKHLHHQPPFWQEVARIMPDYKKWQKMLKRFHTKLL